LGLTVGCFPGALFGARELATLDLTFQNIPFRAVAFAQLQRGEIPLWNPLIGLGFQLLAEGQAGAFYPPHLLLFLLLSASRASTLSVLGHFLGSFIGMWCLLRMQGGSKAGAALGGALMAYGGFFTTRYFLTPLHSSLSWVPWQLCAIDGLRQSRPPSWAWWLLCVASACQVLTGHPPSLFIGLVLQFIYVLTGAVVSPGRWRTLVLGRRVALVWAGVAILTAAQWLPTIEMAGESPRAEGLAVKEAMAMSLPPEFLITSILPSYFGNPANDSVWRPDAGYWWELSVFLGIVPLALMWTAVRRRPALSCRWFIIGWTGLILALGQWTPVSRILLALPGADFFRIPARFFFLSHLAAAALTTIGFDALRNSRNGNVARSFGLALGALAAVALCLAAVNWTALTQPESLSESFFSSARFARLRAGIALDLLVLAACCAIAAVAARAISRWGARWPAVSAIFLASIAPVVLLHNQFHLLLPADVWRAPGLLTAKAQSLNMGGRILNAVTEQNSAYRWHKGWLLDPNAYSSGRESLYPYLGAEAGLAEVSAGGWSPLHSVAFRSIEQRMGPGLLQLLKVDAVVVPEDARLFGYQRAVLRGGNQLVIREERSDLWWTPAQVVIMPDLWTLSAVADGQIDPAETVVLSREEWLRSGCPAVIDRSKIMAWDRAGGCRFSAEIESDGRSVVIWAELFSRGWRCWRDGEEIPVFRANYALMGTCTAPGRHRYCWRYAPRGYHIGLYISLAGALLLATVAVTRWRREIGGERDGGWGTPQRITAILISLILTIGLSMVIMLHDDESSGRRQKVFLESAPAYKMLFEYL